MRTKRNLSRPLLLLTAAIVLVIAAIAFDSANRPAPVGAADRTGTPDLSRAMTFTTPPEPKL